MSFLESAANEYQLGPLLTYEVNDALERAARRSLTTLECSLDLGRSQATVGVTPEGWSWQGTDYPFVESCKERTIYFWDTTRFRPVSRFSDSLIKLVPTQWGAPTFEIDGIKMLPTAKISPVVDAQTKVALIRPRGKRILDTCGGLGYFAVACLQENARSIESFEKNPDVVWLRTLNPWSPENVFRNDQRLMLQQADVSERIGTLGSQMFDAVLHDPPRFGIAGELYSQAFYAELARVMKRNGLLFHYTGTPNKLTTGRDVPNEVSGRLRSAGFTTERRLDGVLAVKR